MPYPVLTGSKSSRRQHCRDLPERRLGATIPTHCAVRGDQTGESGCRVKQESFASHSRDDPFLLGNGNVWPTALDLVFDIVFRFMRLCWISGLVIACLGLVQAQQKFPLVDIQVVGTQRFPSSGVISASGLRLGETAAVEDFDSATQRLSETGLFSSVNYRYDPKTINQIAGYALTWQIQEASATDNVRLDFPEVDEEQLWQELRSANALVNRRMPANASAVEYYRRAIQEALRKRNRNEQIETKNEADLAARTSGVVFRQANLPKIEGVRFDGNTSISSNSLLSALSKIAFIGEEYSEHDVRQLLDLNIKPLYEEIGRLDCPTLKPASSFPRPLCAGTHH